MNEHKIELDQIKKAVKDLGARVDEQAHLLSKKVKDAALSSQEKVKSAIEEKPLQAVGIAVLAGLVLGFLFKKSK